MTKAIRWTPEQLEEYKMRGKMPKPAPRIAIKNLAPAAPEKKPSKYRSRKVKHEGQTFDSEKELRRWLVLVLLQDAGHISELRRQVVFVLAPAVRLDGEPRMKPAIRYIADATYMQDGKFIVEDVKSKPTRTKESYRLKKHLLATVHNLQIKEV